MTSKKKATQILAFDPGETTGMAYWDTSLQDRPLEAGNLKKGTLFKFMDQWDKPLEYVVIEDYIIRSQVAVGKKYYSHTWDKGYTLRVIGSLLRWSHEIGAESVLQQPSIKPVGAGFGNIPHKKGVHYDHYIDALKHGFYFLVKNNYIEPIQ